ncbi:LuxR C-terminal-related transcriptional regulator [Undibacterium sp. TJN19]|uniref:LuxR C-terminal-related transcriptional regulator n=1 Tax=Undibacterium sp. TJN19 TaxID=3413055 RepID=UPI003BF33B0C
MRPVVLVIEEHPMYRDALVAGLQVLLAGSDIFSVGCIEDIASCFSEAINFTLMTLDLGLPGMHGIAALAYLKSRYPQTDCLVLSGVEDRHEVGHALAAGATAFISKRVSLEVIADTIRKVMAHESLAAKWIVRKQKIAPDKAAAFNLTGRQYEILLLLCQGYSNKEIARRLNIVELTVKSHVSTIFKVMAVANRIQAVSAVRRLGLIQDA